MSLFDDVRRLLDGGDDEGGRIEKPTEGENMERQYAIGLETTLQLGSENGIIEALAEGDDGEMYSGSWGRGMFERHQHDENQPIWLGYVEDDIGNAREVGIKLQDLRKHAGVFGMTGSGKTTVLENTMVQLAYGGYGFCYVDPKGKDIKELLLQLPEHRLDDVVWVSPGSSRGKSVSFNLLEAPVPHDDPTFENVVTEMLDDLQSFIAGKHGGGARIEGVVDTIGRAMIESEKPYTLADMYFVLNDEDRRQAFAQEIDDDVLVEYAEKVANMPDEDLDALIRRLKKWVEGRITRELVSTPESDLNFEEVIEDGKIVLVDNSAVDSDDIKQMVSTAVVRSLWAAKKRRVKLNPTESPTSFFLIIDEFDDVVTSASGDAMQIGNILSQARSSWLSLIMASQFPSQIPDEVLEELYGNTKTLLNLKVKLEKDARTLAKQLKDVNGQPITKTDIIQLPEFQTWYQFTLNKETKEPVIVDNFAPYPPLREDSAIEYLINRSLDRYGSDRIEVDSLEEICLINGNPDDEDDETPVEVAHVLNAIDIACIYEDADHASEETVRTVLEALQVDTGYVALDNVIEKSGHLIDVNSGSPNHLGLTTEGQATLAEQLDTGAGGNAGSLKHRLLLQDTREELAKEGIVVALLEQDGEMPDGLAYPFALDDDSTLAPLFEGQEMAHVEAETTTQTKPAKTLKNLRKAREQGLPCLFTVREDNDKGLMYEAKKVEAFALDNPSCARGTKPFGIWLYNYNSPFEQQDGDSVIYPVRPIGEDDGTTRWFEASGQYVLMDSADQEHARFDTIDDLLNWSPEDWPAHAVKERGNVVVWQNGRSSRYSSLTEMGKDGWSQIKTPFIPEVEMPVGAMPDADSLASLVIPSDDLDEDPQMFQHGQQTPLHVGEGQTPTADSSEPKHPQETSIEDEFRATPEDGADTPDSDRPDVGEVVVKFDEDETDEVLEEPNDVESTDESDDPDDEDEDGDDSGSLLFG